MDLKEEVSCETLINLKVKQLEMLNKGQIGGMKLCLEGLWFLQLVTTSYEDILQSKLLAKGNKKQKKISKPVTLLRVM